MRKYVSGVAKRMRAFGSRNTFSWDVPILHNSCKREGTAFANKNIRDLFRIEWRLSALSINAITYSVVTAIKVLEKKRYFVDYN